MAVKILLASSASNLGARMLGPTWLDLQQSVWHGGSRVWEEPACRRTILPSWLSKLLTTYCLPACLHPPTPHRSVPG